MNISELLKGRKCKMVCKGFKGQIYGALVVLLSFLSFRGVM